MALDFHDMQEMQKRLQERYAGWWEPVDAEHGRNKVLWMLAELGEAIQVLKRKQTSEIMEKGVVAQIGTPQEIYYHPASEFVADFIGEANFLKGQLSQKNADSAIVTVEGYPVPVVGVSELPEGKDCTLVLRPESAVLADSGVLPCKVIVSCFMGSYQNYHVMVGDTLVKITDYNPRNKKIYAVGDTAWVSFEKENVHVL